MSTMKPNMWMDRLAMSLSGLCLIHCLGGALLVALLSTGGGFFLSHRIHEVGLALALPLASIALWRGAAAHGRWAVIVLGVIGLAAMAAGLIQPHGRTIEVALTITGVGLLGLAHFCNIRARG